MAAALIVMLILCPPSLPDLLSALSAGLLWASDINPCPPLVSLASDPCAVILCPHTPRYANRRPGQASDSPLLSSPHSALGLLHFIRRGKQCLDFTVTVHFFHLLGCWLYSSRFPSALTWWLVQAVCIALMAVIGEYLCMRSELKEIPLNSAPKSSV